MSAVKVTELGEWYVKRTCAVPRKLYGGGKEMGVCGEQGALSGASERLAKRAIVSPGGVVVVRMR